MAKKRILKKYIGYIADDLLTEVLVYKMLAPDAEQEKIETLLTRIANMQDTFIFRAHHPDGKDNKVLVREYYRKLMVDLEAEVNALVEEIEALRNGKPE